MLVATSILSFGCETMAGSLTLKKGGFKCVKTIAKTKVIAATDKVMFRETVKSENVTNIAKTSFRTKATPLSLPVI